MDNEKKPQENVVEQSFIHIQFAGPGSVFYTMDMNNVTPLQMLALSQYLEFKGKQALAQQEYMQAQQREANKIAVPRIMTK